MINEERIRERAEKFVRMLDAAVEELADGTNFCVVLNHPLDEEEVTIFSNLSPEATLKILSRAVVEVRSNEPEVVSSGPPVMGSA